MSRLFLFGLLARCEGGPGGNRGRNLMLLKFGEADSIYYLSDGALVSGAFSNWRSIIPSYKYFHRYRPMALFAVEFESGNRNSEMMSVFARQNYGKSGSTKDAADD